MPEDFIFTISRRRKYPALRINADGKLEFLAPYGFSIERARKLVEKNQAAVDRLRRRQAKHQVPKREWKEGMTVYWYGKLLPVYFTSRAHAVTDEALYVPAGGEELIKSGLAKLYKAEAYRYLSLRTAFLAEKFSISYRTLSVGGAKSRWGSCGRDGRLRFSWKLIQCDTKLIDYVIIHELAHRKVFNHSSAFWQTVGAMEPEYEEIRRSLLHFSKKVELL